MSGPAAPNEQPRFRVKSLGGSGTLYDLAPDLPARVHVIGRDEGASLRLHDDRVSRKHAEITQTDGEWLVRDLGSRSGTFLNGRKLTATERAPLELGSELHIGPYCLQLVAGSSKRNALPKNDDGASSIVHEIAPAQAGALAAHRLQLLLDLAGRLHAAPDATDAMDLVAAALISGTRYGRALLLLDGASGAERLATRAVTPGAWNAPISSSLLSAARARRSTVRLEDRQELHAAASILGSGVQDALCIPIVPANDDPLSLQTVAYLDSPGGTGPPERDAADFARAACQLAALYLESSDRRSLQADVDAMREVQIRLTPPDSFTIGNWAVHTRTVPGRGAAGDILGVCPTRDGDTVVIVGDVSGKGPAAAMLMASVVSHLHACLAASSDLSAALAQLSNYIVDQFGGERFATAVAFRIPRQGQLHIVDAGHGVLVRVGGTGAAQTLVVEGGPPLGAVPHASYPSEALELSAGERMVICTDGVTEQFSPAGAMFGQDGLIEALRGSSSCEEDVARILAAVRNHAAQPNFTDDVTIVSVGAS